ncbi:MAG: hypothetical protein PGN26_14630 [Xylophilus ampelinus]
MMLLAINLLAAAAVLAHAVCAINHMDGHTWHVQRVFYIAMALGAFAVMLGPLYGYRQPQPGEVLLNLGAAGVLLCRVWLDWRAQRGAGGRA